MENINYYQKMMTTKYNHQKGHNNLASVSSS